MKNNKWLGWRIGEGGKTEKSGVEKEQKQLSVCNRCLYYSHLKDRHYLYRNTEEAFEKQDSWIDPKLTQSDPKCCGNHDVSEI